MRTVCVAALSLVAGLCASASGAQPDSAPAGSSKIHPALSARFETRNDPVKAWVYFTDKGTTTPAELEAALADLERTYDPNALNRRRMRRTDPGLFDVRDLPVPTAYRTGVGGTGAVIHAESRWLNAVSVRTTCEQAERIAALPFVRSLEPVRGGRRDAARDIERLPNGGYDARAFYGRSEAQLAQINLIALHNQGHTGAGVRVGILDTGFRRDHEAFTLPGHPLVVVAERDFINNDGNTTNEGADAPDQHEHGTLILGTLGAYKPEDLVGGAYNASFILCKTEDVTSETPVEEDNYIAAIEFIELNGGDMATSSLSYSDWYTQADMNGVTAPTSVAVNVATINGLHCCTAAGNAGHDDDPLTSHLGAPADALRVITCGAVNSSSATASFSSDGPSADGRVKPEVLARGVSTRTVHYADTVSYASASGTSLSTPLVAAAVACLAGARPTWTTDQMRAALMTTATDFVGSGLFDPLFVRGYGVVDAAAALSAIPSCGSADFDGDGDTGTDSDIEAFFACLGGNCCGARGSADFDSDGDTGTDSDIEAFFRVLGGGAC